MVEPCKLLLYRESTKRGNLSGYDRPAKGCLTQEMPSLYILMREANSMAYG
jgi:hypothetical protein